MRILTFFLLVCVLVSCSAGSTNLKQLQAENPDYPALEKEYEAKIKQEPDGLNNYYVLAFVYYKQNKLDKAEETLNSLIAKEPFQARYYTLLGQVYFDKREYVSAQQSFTLAILYQKNLIDAHIGLARTLEEIQNYAKAMSVIDNALLLSPDNLNLQMLKIRVESKLIPTTSNYVRLIEQTKNLYVRDPNNFAVLLLLITLNEQIGRDQLAIDILQKEANKFKNNLDLPEKLCFLYVKNNQTDKALELLAKLPTAATQPALPSIALFHCKIMAMLYSDPKNVEKTFQAEKAFYLPGVELDLVAAQVALGQERYLAAIQTLQSLYFVSTKPDFYLLYLLANAYQQTQDYDKVGIYLKQALAIDPNNFDAKMLEVNWLLSTGKLEEANTLFFAENFPLENPKTLETLGNIYLAQKNFVQAEKYYSLANKLQFRVSTALRLAQLQFERGNFNQALKSLEELLYMYPDSKRVVTELASYYYYLKSYPKVSQLYTQKPASISDVQLNMIYGLNFLASNNETQGLKILKETAAEHPNNVLLIDQLTLYLGSKKRYMDAIPYLEILLSSNQPSAQYLYGRLADYYAKAGLKQKSDIAQKTYFGRDF